MARVKSIWTATTTETGSATPAGSTSPGVTADMRSIVGVNFAHFGVDACWIVTWLADLDLKFSSVLYRTRCYDTYGTIHRLMGFLPPRLVRQVSSDLASWD